MKAINQFLINRWPILLSLVFILIAMIGYYIREWPTSKIYVLHDEIGHASLLINGQDVTTYEQHVPGWEVYARYFKVYGDQSSNRFVIQKHGMQLFKKELAPGSYVVNLSNNYNISFHEIAYGRSIDSPGLFLSASPTGVYLIDNTLDILVFDFFKDPPDSMTSRHGSAKRRRYLNLIAEKNE